MVSKKVNKTNKYVQINIAIAMFLFLVMGAIFINNTGMLTGFTILGNETNQTLIENETIINETIINFTIPIINETLNTTIINETTNQTIVNETIIEEIVNETITNQTIINETTQELNQTIQLNKTEEPPQDNFSIAGTVTCNSCKDCGSKVNNTANEIVQLSTDISVAGGTCINATNTNFENRTLDCQGYKITGSSTDIGIELIDQENVTIKNCNISYFDYAIKIRNSVNFTSYSNNLSKNDLEGFDGMDSDYINITNTNIFTNKRGINISNSSYGRYIDNEIYRNNEAQSLSTAAGIRMAEVNYTNFIDNYIYDNEYGSVYCKDCSNLSFINNTFKKDAIIPDTSLDIQYGQGNILIYNNTFTGYSSYMGGPGESSYHLELDYGAGQRANITLNLFEFSYGGIDLRKSNAGNQENITINDNNISLQSSSVEGIILQRANHTSIKNNIIENTGDDGIDAGSLTTWADDINITNNILTDCGGTNDFSIFVRQSNDMEISYNTILDGGGYGIYTDESDKSKIFNNTIKGHSLEGIYLDASTTNIIDSNTIRDQKRAIQIAASSTNNNITDNDLANISQWAYYSIICNNYMHNSSNTGGHNNKPIFYHNNTATTVNTQDYSEMHLCDADGTTINNITINNSGTNSSGGIHLRDSDDVTIANSTITNAYFGIYIDNSDNLNITNNSIFNNSQKGIFMEDSDNADIYINTIKNNSNAGIYLDNTDFINISGNTILNHENQEAITFDAAGTQDNKNIIEYNNISNTGADAILCDCRSSNITYNTIEDSDSDGIQILDTLNIISNNTIIDITATGIIGGSTNIIKSNNITNTNKGITEAGKNLVSGNLINDSRNQGIYSSSTNSNITGNRIFNTTLEAIEIRSNHNIISGNIIKNQTTGIELSQAGSDDNNITGNNITKSSNAGIDITNAFADTNLIYNNYLNNSKNAGDLSAAGNNLWNTSKTEGTSIIGGPYLGGNFWGDYYEQKNLTDRSGDGFGNDLLPWNATYSTRISGTGVQDHLPLRQIRCNDVLTDNANLSNYHAVTDCNSDGLIMQNDSITLDCKGNGINGTDRFSGIYINGSHNVTVRNCRIYNYSNAIYINNSNGSIIKRNILRYNLIGINITSNSKEGLIYYNYFNNTNHTNAYDAGTNIWYDDDTVGNYWSDYSRENYTDTPRDDYDLSIEIGGKPIQGTNPPQANNIDHDPRPLSSWGEIWECGFWITPEDSGRTFNLSNDVACLEENGINIANSGGFLGFLFGASAIEVDGITIDCNGYTLSGDSRHAGISFDGDANSNNKEFKNSVIKNCDIRNFRNGIEFKSDAFADAGWKVGSGCTYRQGYDTATANTIQDNTIADNTYGFYFESDEDENPGWDCYDENENADIYSNTIQRNNITNNTYGFYFWNDDDGDDYTNIRGASEEGFVRDNIIRNNTIQDNILRGIYFDTRESAVKDNKIYNNKFKDNGRHTDNTAGKNYWNDTYTCTKQNILGGNCWGGNYWDGFFTLDDGSGTSYPHKKGLDGIGDSNETYTQSLVNDYLPLATNPGCAYGVNQTYSLSGDLLDATGASKCNDTIAIIINNSNLIFSCSNFTMRGIYNNTGIYVNHSTNVTIRDCNIFDFNISIHLNVSYNSTIYNNNMTNNTIGINLTGSSNNTIYNNYFNNSINAMDIGTNIWNTSYDCTRTNIRGSSCMGGNAWDDYTGDDDGSGSGRVAGDLIGDTNLPHNSTNNITIGGDYLPLLAMGADTTNPKTRLKFPKNDSTITNTSYLNFTYNVSEFNNIINCSLYIGYDTSTLNTINSTDTSITKNTNQSFNLTFTKNSTHKYYWKVGCADANSNQGDSPRWVTTRNEQTALLSIFPKNSTKTWDTPYINFTYNVSDEDVGDIQNCSVYLHNGIKWERNKTDTVINQNINETINTTLENLDNLKWKIGCYDKLSQQYNSTAFNITIDYAACGDGLCETGENSGNCDADCPAPPVTPPGGPDDPPPPPVTPPPPPPVVPPVTPPTDPTDPVIEDTDLDETNLDRNFVSMLRGLLMDAIIANRSIDEPTKPEFQTICKETWTCTDWYMCRPKNTRYKECIDLNNCDKLYNQSLVGQMIKSPKPTTRKRCVFIPTILWLIITLTIITVVLRKNIKNYKKTKLYKAYQKLKKKHKEFKKRPTFTLMKLIVSIDNFNIKLQKKFKSKKLRKLLSATTNILLKIDKKLKRRSQRKALHKIKQENKEISRKFWKTKLPHKKVKPKKHKAISKIEKKIEKVDLKAKKIRKTIKAVENKISKSSSKVLKVIKKVTLITFTKRKLAKINKKREKLQKKKKLKEFLSKPITKAITKVQITTNFDKKFKSSLTKAAKRGFTFADIQKQLAKQGYPKTSINNLITKAKSDKNITKLMKKKTKKKAINKLEKIIETLDSKILKIRKKEKKVMHKLILFK